MRRFLAAGFLALSSGLIALACGGGGDSSADGGPGSGGPLFCPLSGGCSQAELDGYSTCIRSACDTELAACYGASDALGGACGSYQACANACGCGATVECVEACGEPSQDCLTCVADFADCLLGSSCVRPACLDGRPDGGSSG